MIEFIAGAACSAVVLISAVAMIGESDSTSENPEFEKYMKELRSDFAAHTRMNKQTQFESDFNEFHKSRGGKS
jgi:hypothetical protein